MCAMLVNLRIDSTCVRRDRNDCFEYMSIGTDKNKKIRFFTFDQGMSDKLLAIKQGTNVLVKVRKEETDMYEILTILN